MREPMSSEAREKLKKKVLSNLSEAEEIDARKYDPSYEMVQKACEVYAKDFPETLNHSDLDLFNYLLVSIDNDTRRKKIEGSSLSRSSKEELLRTLYATEGNNYQYEGEKGCYGMFARTTGTFDRETGTSEKDAKRLVSLFAALSGVEDPNLKLFLVGEVFKDPIKGFRNGSASQILHCIDPEVFPILNGHQGRESVYAILEVNGLPDKESGLNDLTRYVEYCEKIQRYRNEHFSFKNYRIFDIQEEGFPSNCDD